MEKLHERANKLFDLSASIRKFSKLVPERSYYEFNRKIVCIQDCIQILKKITCETSVPRNSESVTSKSGIGELI